MKENSLGRTGKTEIIRAKPGGAAVLTDIAFKAKRHWGYPEKWIENWRDILTIAPEMITAEETYSALVDGRTVGFYIFAPRAKPPRLDHLWVLPEMHGRGIGRALFEHAIERAKSLGCALFEIEGDPNAEAFYKRMGALRIGENFSEIEGRRRLLPILVYKVSVDLPPATNSE